MKFLQILILLTLYSTASSQSVDSIQSDSVMNVVEAKEDTVVPEEELISELYTEAILSTLSDDYFKGRDIRDPRINEVIDYLVSVMKNNGFKPIEENVFDFEFSITESLSSKYIIAVYHGDSSTKKAIMLTANYDNIGVFQRNSFSDSIYNGANDNASGVTALIQTALYLINKDIKRNIVIVLTSGRRYGYSGHGVISDHLLKNNYRIDYAFNFIRLAQPVSQNSNSIFISGSKNCKDVAQSINNEKGYNIVIPVDELNPMKESEQPIHKLIENLTGAECYTFTTFNFSNDPYFFTPKDDYSNVDIKFFHNLILNLSNSIYKFLEKNP